MDLVPSEHLGEGGLDADFAAALVQQPGWSSDHVALLEAGLDRYWTRYEDLATHARYLRPPRLRNVGVVRESASVRPYSQILNESTCTLYIEDLDPRSSHAEFVAYLLALGERMAETGEILRAAIHLAPWWFDRTDEEKDAFVAAARRSTRPDAALYRAIADAVPWLAQLRHRRLRPPRKGGGHREIPGTGLLVPRAVEREPDRLLSRVQAEASRNLGSFQERYRGDDEGTVAELARWLTDDRPPVVVTDGRRSIVWDPDAAPDPSALAQRLAGCGPAIVQHVRGDLACIADHSRRFLSSLRDPDSLPTPDPDLGQGGYTFLHHESRRIAYNLDEPGIERLLGPGIPYARSMLGARTAHEWAHLAVDGGCVPRTVDEEGWQAMRRRFAGILDEVVAALPREVREITAADRRSLEAAGSVGLGLVGMFERRLPDFQANLLAQRYQSEAEREAYVRQNIRPLGREYTPAEGLRMLVRYVYELQYLHFSRIEAPRAYFYEITWFETDFFETGILEEAALDALSEAARSMCLAYRVDHRRFVDPT